MIKRARLLLLCFRLQGTAVLQLTVYFIENVSLHPTHQIHERSYEVFFGEMAKESIVLWQTFLYPTCLVTNGRTDSFYTRFTFCIFRNRLALFAIIYAIGTV